MRLNPTATKDVILAEHLETLRYGSFNIRLQGMHELEPRRIKSLNRPQCLKPAASERQGHSHARSRSIRHKVFCRLPLGQNGNDSLDAQIRIFKEREDLRECLIPGMVSGISQKACEGWQRQATARSARFMAKIKLGPCKDCKYFSEPSGSPLRRKNSKKRLWMMS